MRVQGMFKQIQTLVTSSASPVAGTAAPDAASALLTQLAASEYRRQSIELGGGVTDVSDRNALREEEEAEEMARRAQVEATLLKEQEAGVAAVVAVAETQKKNLEKELDQAGATVEEKKVQYHASHRSRSKSRSRSRSRRSIFCGREMLHRTSYHLL